MRVRVRVRARVGVGVGVGVRVGDAIPAHLEEGVQVIGQLGVTACVSTPLWQSPPNGKRRGPASSERA